MCHARMRRQIDKHFYSHPFFYFFIWYSKSFFGLWYKFIRQRILNCNCLPFFQSNLFPQNSTYNRIISTYIINSNMPVQRESEEKERTKRLLVRATVPFGRWFMGGPKKPELLKSGADRYNKIKVCSRSNSDLDTQTSIYVTLPSKNVVILGILKTMDEFNECWGPLIVSYATYQDDML